MQLRINQTVELTLLGGEMPGPLRTHVLAVDPEGIVLALPMARQKWVVPAPGTRVRVVYRDPQDRQAERGLFGFTTVVLAARLQPEPLLRLAPPERVERVQRREWVRLDVRLPVRLERPGNPPEVLEVRTLDISGGGLRLLSPRPLRPGELVRLQIAFPGGWEVRATGRVVRAEAVEREQHEAGVEFVEIDPRLQDRIAGFILAEQARRRRVLG